MKGSAAACSFCWVSSAAMLAAVFFSHLRAEAPRAGETYDLFGRGRRLRADLRSRLIS
jgi:hypothetical protein